MLRALPLFPFLFSDAAFASSLLLALRCLPLVLLAVQALSSSSGRRGCLLPARLSFAKHKFSSTMHPQRRAGTGLHPASKACTCSLFPLTLQEKFVTTLLAASRPAASVERNSLQSSSSSSCLLSPQSEGELLTCVILAPRMQAAARLQHLDRSKLACTPAVRELCRHCCSKGAWTRLLPEVLPSLEKGIPSLSKKSFLGAGTIQSKPCRHPPCKELEFFS